MSSKDSIQDTPNPAEEIRALAAREAEPKERELLLRSTQKVDDAHRQVAAAIAELDASLQDARTFVQLQKAKGRLPTWFVVLVFAFLFAFLIYVTVRNHV